MKIIFKREPLTKLLRDALRVVPTSTIRPTLKHLLIHANKEEQRVDIFASSDEVSIRRTMYELVLDSPVVIETSGACLIPAKELSDIVKSATEDIILEAASEHRVEIRFGRTKFELSTLTPDLFHPYENEQATVTKARICAPALRTLLRRTMHACATNTARPILTGVNLTVSGDKMAAVGTDGLRLSAFQVGGVALEGETQSLTVPKDTLERLFVMLPQDEDEEIALELGATSFVATWGENAVRFAMRGLDGAFPDVSRIIPESPETVAVSNRIKLLEACERVSILNEHSEAEFRFEAGDLFLFSESALYGSAADHISLTTTERDLTVWVNIAHWIATLRSLDGVDEIKIGTSTGAQTMNVHPVTGGGICLLSPLQRPSRTNLKQETKSA